MKFDKFDTGKLPKIDRVGIALDIDETLSYTNGYWFSEMQRLFGNPENLSIEELIAKYRYMQNVPYWQTPEALAWAEEQRNSNEIQTKLPLIKEADNYVHKINKVIPIVAYISIRPDMVLDGTQTWLDLFGFPKAPIICRPKNMSMEQGSEWKASVLEKLYPKVLGIIDDNHAVLKYLAKDYKGIIFLFDHEKVLDSPVKNIPCKDWEATYKNVRSAFRDKL